jgi:hypothetical protein
LKVKGGVLKCSASVECVLGLLVLKLSAEERSKHLST